MKYLLSILGSLIISGCTLTVKPDADVTKVLEQHSAVINAITNYIADCQEKGICPKPEVKE